MTTRPKRVHPIPQASSSRTSTSLTEVWWSIRNFFVHSQQQFAHQEFASVIEAHLQRLQTQRSHHKLLRRIQSDLRFHNELDSIQASYNAYVKSRVDTRVTLIGAGKMGSALLHSWRDLGLSQNEILVVEARPSEQLRNFTKENQIDVVPTIDDVEASSVLVVAVKPQDSQELIPRLSRLVRNRTLIISIMAGKTLRTLEHQVRQNTAIVRAMPNLPALIGRGITAAVANEAVTNEQRELASALLAATGGIVWVDKEHLMDAVTAVSGSGPAYVFLLAECLERAAQAAGLPPHLAKQLAVATVAGAGELLDGSSSDATTLRQNVTSKGGTTAAALDVLMSDSGLDQILTKAVIAAANRSRELAS